MSSATTCKEFHGGVSHVDRYGWAQLDVGQGSLASVYKNKINIDRKYQRELREDKVNDIARNFWWPSFGVICVAERANGSLWAYDGQHRLCAAQKRADITSVPCIIYKSAHVRVEAKGFLGTNAGRAQVTANAKLKSRLIAQEPEAILVCRLAEACGRTFGTHGPRGISCVGSMVKFAQQAPEHLERAWPVIESACKGRAVDEAVMCGLMYIETHLPDGVSISDQKWRRRVIDVGGEDLLKEARRAAALYSRGGSKVWAAGILGRLNKGIREGSHLVMVA